MEISVPEAVLFIIPLIVALSLAVWWTVVVRVSNRQAIVAYEPRRSVPWNGLDLVAVLFIYLGGLAAVIGLSGGLPERNTAHTVLEEDSEQAPPAVDSPRNWTATLVGMLVGVVGAGWFVQWRSGATPRDFGFLPLRPIYDLAVGLLGFAAIALPVYASTYVLTRIWPSRHPLLEDLEASPDPALFAMLTIIAVIVAPISEEFVFRGLLQGWLERLVAPRPAKPAVLAETPLDEQRPEQLEPPPTLSATAPAEDSAFDAAYRPPDEQPSEAEVLATAASERLQPEASGIRAAMPILITSALFAAAHAGYGPDPIPLFVFALALGYLYYRTHRLWPSIVVHMSLNGLSMLLAWFELFGGAE